MLLHNIDYIWKPNYYYSNCILIHLELIHLPDPCCLPVFPLSFTYLATCTHPYWLVKYSILSVHKLASDVCLCRKIMQWWKGINLCIQIGYKKTMYLKCCNKCNTVTYLEPVPEYLLECSFMGNVMTISTVDHPDHSFTNKYESSQGYIYTFWSLSCQTLLYSYQKNKFFIIKVLIFLY
jgi:hypothetical protein